MNIEYPLNEIYERNGRSLPELVPQTPTEVPQPYRGLLIHQRDMTPTLSNFHKSLIRIEALHSWQSNQMYYREVLLFSKASDRPLLYGGIKINLDLLPKDAAQKVLAEKEPLGGILAEYKVEHSSEPSAYFKIQAGSFIAEKLAVDKGSLLYGRRNTLYSPNKEAIAEIVEILPLEQTIEKDYDVVIFGGGPSGSSAAKIIADEGFKVLVVEKDTFPRYRVGESLIPYCYYPLKRLGMIEKMQGSHFQSKKSVQFVTQDGKLSAPFYFMKHMEHEAANTWQVKRSEFDIMMRDNAVEAGAEFREGTSFKKLIRDDENTPQQVEISCEGKNEVLSARMFLDCTGKDTVTMSQQKWRVTDKELKKMAIWTYYKGAKRDEGIDEGATTVAYVDEKGWFWYIPLHDDMVSVGVVGERDYLFDEGRDLKAIFDREVEKNLWIKDHLSQGEVVVDYKVTSEFSYRSKYCAEDNLLLVGDAFAFLDPVFSSGVFLALYSGVLAGESVVEAFRGNDTRAASFTEYGQKFCNGLEAMRTLVYAFYDQDFSFGKFIKKYPHLHSDLTDCLIGNLYRDFDELFKAMRDFADLPEPLSHGKPKEETVYSN
ncbi:MAG: tryptophan 7-halogenase [Lentisphaeraceae bacterium]|nr:tryptophan 7-halogenase [Lentisphaeraceae bacterium]